MGNASGSVRSHRPTWYEIDLDAVAANTRELRRLVGADVAIYACLKRNAYGCGAAAVGRVTTAAGADGLAVGNIDDALAVRRAGVTAPILLYPTCLPDEAATVEAHDFTVTVSTPDEAEAWNAALAGPHGIFLKVDVGLFRAGALPESLPALIDALRRSPRLVPLGMYGHFYGYGGAPSPGYYEWQFDNMRRCRDIAQAAGLRLPVVMVSASGTVLDRAEMDLTGVDPGAALLGQPAGRSSVRGAAIRPAFRAFKTRLLMRKPVGDAATGGHPTPFPLTPDMEIGILPVGWGDGIPRPLPAEAGALLRGRRARLLGPIHLEHLRIDLTNHPDARPGDEVVLIGRQGDAEIGLDEILRTWRLDWMGFHAGLRDHIERRYSGGES